ncbi:YidC/Oxa1 family membrane protein insertase [Mycoplasmoides fastidiosum]|uniref:YidC/Oxa1 family membrane protein insertase n=1 Tax=Mycoplasmoides fastidiosum TaxID=92758 RepID=A0ABU0LYP7_9BACT|nr:membrane protein insertase YidC [Mycoplasmoides fastidiosum]MDQ0513813.1 YidC/Oxa1 family membrane protein insertase [Mycoplasmoides fastidiosum]UUD37770.1 membrane protein insertase YidC [Mycoplasmoides fastidiosum]
MYLSSHHIYHFSQSQTIRSEKIIKPFWETKKSFKDPKERNKTRRLIIKWTKFIVYSFVFIITLWGCFQQFGQPYVITIPSVGQGLEFGFNSGTTGDWRFDLAAAGTGDYWVFSEYTITYGPFLSWFVYPFAWITLHISYAFRAISYGGFSTLFTMLIILILMRALGFWPSLKASFLTEKQLEHQGALAEINAKYAKVERDDKQAKMRKNQEISEYNKKHGINPLGAFEKTFVDLPIFLIIWRLFSMLRPIKATILFGIWDLGAVPFYSIFQHFGEGGWVYIFLLLFVLPTQFFSQRLPVYLSKKRNRKASTITTEGKKSGDKNQRIQTIMTVMFLFFTVILSSGIGVYYFFSAWITISQTLIIHHIIMKKRRQGVTIDDYLSRLGIKSSIDPSRLIQ